MSAPNFLTPAPPKTTRHRETLHPPARIVVICRVSRYLPPNETEDFMKAASAARERLLPLQQDAQSDANASDSNVQSACPWHGGGSANAKADVEATPASVVRDCGSVDKIEGVLQKERRRVELPLPPVGTVAAAAATAAATLDEGMSDGRGTVHVV